jgi:ATP-dependent DNA ligase
MIVLPTASGSRKFWPMRPMSIWPNSPTFDRYMADEGWTGEPKRNGFRVIVTPKTVTTRHGNNVTPDVRNPDTLARMRAMPPDSIVDGELLGDESTREAVLSTGNLVLFDVIRWNGENMFGNEMAERKALLVETFGDVVVQGGTSAADKARIWTAAKAGQYEGIVFKRVGSLYRLQNRKEEESPDWIKSRVDMTRS